MNFGLEDLHPVSGISIGRIAVVDILAKCEVTDRSPVDVMTSDLAQHFRRGKGDLTAYVWQAAMGWDKCERVALSPDHAKDSNVYSVFEILLSQVFWYGAIFPHCTNVKLFARPER